MAEFSRLVVTRKGQSLIAKILAGVASDVEFTKIAAADTSYTVDELEGLENLPNIIQEAEISRKTRNNEVSVKVESAFSNVELTVGYHMQTLGLYARDPDEGEILYAVTVETSGNCYMPPYNGITVSGAHIQLVTTVGNADNVSLKVNPSVYATIEDIIELRGLIEILQDKTERFRQSRRVIATRVRDPTKPDYGMTQNNVQGRAAILDAAPYTGGSEVSAIVNGVEYDASNMSANGAGSPDGTLLLKKMEE